MKIQLLTHKSSKVDYFNTVISDAVSCHDSKYFIITNPFSMNDEKALSMEKNERDVFFENRIKKVSFLPYVYHKTDIEHYKWLNEKQIMQMTDNEWYTILFYRKNLFHCALDLCMSFDQKTWTFYDSPQEDQSIITSKKFNDVLTLLIEEMEDLFSESIFKTTESMTFEDLTLQPLTDYSSLALSKMIPCSNLKNIVVNLNHIEIIPINHDALFDQFIKTTKDMSFKNFELTDHIITSHRGLE